NKPQLQRNTPFRFVNLLKRDLFLSLRAIPFLIVLASLAIQPAVRGQVVKTIPVTAPKEILSIVPNPVYSEVYVADLQNDRVAVIDTGSNQISFFIHPVFEPFGLGVSSDGNTLYVTDKHDFLEAISLTTCTTLFLVPVDKAPQLPGISSDGCTVYVPCQSPTGTVVPVGGPLSGTSIRVGGSPVQAVFNHGNTSAYVTTQTKKLAIINTATGSVTKIATPTPTYGLAMTGATLFVTGINEVFVINTNTNTIVDTIRVPTPPGKWFLDPPGLTPDGAFLYVPVEVNTSFSIENDTVVVINTKARKVAGEPISVGLAPVQVAAAADDIYGYSSNFADGTVTAFYLAHLHPH
ncbi:MAG TPA: YncE family protein, partial [Chthoniobacterales bacterium]